MSTKNESGSVNGFFSSMPNFEWKPEYDDALENIASSDLVETEWSLLRDMLKYKFEENIADFIRDPRISHPRSPTRSPDSNPALSPKTLTSGGLRLPPFPKRDNNEMTMRENNSYKPRKNLLSEDEAREIKESIFSQLQDFDGQPPFTIQRLCELALHPRQHYTNVGKYLRAVETSLLVTSTWDAYPPTSGEPSTSMSAYSNAVLREATTPLFSPIPFLHDDARRSRSRSPPMSPLELAAKRQLSPHPEDLILAAAVIESNNDRPDGPVIGLVDELDDPSPGHMSVHPTALTAVTSAGPAAIHASLEERFTKASVDDVAESDAVKNDKGKEKKKQQEEDDSEVEHMVVDEADDDKENKG